MRYTETQTTQQTHGIFTYKLLNFNQPMIPM